MANKIWCGGFGTIVEDHGKATEALKPGSVLRRVAEADSDGGYAAHDGGVAIPVLVALDAPDENRGIDDDYAVGDDVRAGVFSSGALLLLIADENQDLEHGDKVKVSTNGKVIEGSDADFDIIGQVVFDRYDDHPVVTGAGETARVKVEVR